MLPVFVACPAPAAAVFFSRLDRRKGVRRNYYDRLPGLFRNHTDRAGYDVVPRVFVAVGEMSFFVFFVAETVEAVNLFVGGCG